MGRKAKPPPPPTPPSQQQFQNAGRNDAAFNRWNEVGPGGSVNWSVRPGADPNNLQAGDYIRTTTLSPEQQQLRDQTTGWGTQLGNWAGDQLAQFQPDAAARDRLTESLYRRNTQFYDRRFGADQNSLEAKLANQGLARGSEGWNRELARFGEEKNQAYGDATDRAVIGGEQEARASQQAAFERIMQAFGGGFGGLQGNMMTPMSQNTGGGLNDFAGLNAFSNAQQALYGNQVAATNARNAGITGTNQLLGTLGGLGLGAAALFKK